MSCGHSSPKGFLCERESGHSEFHSYMEEREEACFWVHRWNDAGEGEPRAKGNAVYVTADGQNSAVDELIADASQKLASGAVYELRKAVGRPPWDGIGLAWYWMPAPSECPVGFESFGMEQEPLFLRHPDDGIYDAIRGVIIFGRLKAGQLLNEVKQ